MKILTNSLSLQVLVSSSNRLGLKGIIYVKPSSMSVYTVCALAASADMIFFFLMTNPSV